MKNYENYYLGLDIGTDSVGYAVTDENYNLLKYKGKKMWGSHIFDAASNQNERRGFRSARRRLERKQHRVKLVRELFAKEIYKIDPTFFRRIDESRLFSEDASDPKGLFVDEQYNDKNYHKKYPTIHHLIVDLIKNKNVHDVREVYLACSWLIAHRGHFLSEVSKENVANITDFSNSYNNLMEYFEEKPWCNCDPQDVCDVLQKKIYKKEKKNELIKLLYKEDKPFKNDIYSGLGEKVNREKLIEFLCGSKVKICELFDKEEYEELGSISIDINDENLMNLQPNIGDDLELIILCKAVNDCIILKDILGNEKYLSNNKVNTYNDHKNDLKNLKKIIRKYAPEHYKAMFNEIDGNNYVAYTGHDKYIKNRDKSKKVTNDAFGDYTKKIIEKIICKIEDNEDQKVVNEILDKISKGTFMPKQVNSDNRVIPYQVYWIELEQILNNAKEYLPFLEEKDEKGYSTCDKLFATFEFRIPYYVGPLNLNSDKAWAVRKNEKIYPWNFDEIVDKDRSEQEFIAKLTNTCTYLPNEPVLPKNSIVYEKFQVLNEINNIKVNGRSLTTEVKQGLFSNVFSKKKKVTIKNIRDYLLVNGYFDEDELKTLSGVDITIKSSLATSISFRKLLTSEQLTLDSIENIILHSTYSEDKNRFIKWIKTYYANLTDDDVKYIASIKCKDFGRLSKKLLTGIHGMNKETGEVNTILGFMWDHQYNLMKLLSDTFDFAEKIEIERSDYYSNKKQTLNDRLDDMYVPNGSKRPIYRTLAVLNDVIKAENGVAPKKIFIEMARGGGEKGNRTKSRYEQLIELYKRVDGEDVRLLQRQLEALGDDANTKLQSEKLFLYYLQLGKCMYTGEPIENLNDLKDDSLYNIDHIYPQAQVKDDSLLNKVLVKSQENANKADNYPISPAIQQKMKGYWNRLKDSNLISDEKYRRLVRTTEFTKDEKWNFINRQLVETRQSTKALATILKEKYPYTEIVYVKSSLVSDFRHEYGICKSRLVNDLHHAKDAYLNIVVGNVYYSLFTHKWFEENWEKHYSIKTSTIFDRPKLNNNRNIWNGKESLEKVKSIVGKDDAQLTKFAFCKKGGFFDQMPVKANNNLVELKKGLSTEKYGGYNKPSCAFFMLVKFVLKKKNEVMILPVDLLVSHRVQNDEKFAIEYLKKQIKVIANTEVESVELPIGLTPLKVNTVFECDGFRMCVTGKDSGGKLISLNVLEPLKLSMENVEYCKKLEKFVEKVAVNKNHVYHEKYDKVNFEKNLELFNLLLEKLTSVYSARPEISIDRITKQKDRFASLPIFEQSKALLELITLFNRSANVTKIIELGGGACRLNAKLSNWMKKYNDVRIVNVSASGLFENKSANLMMLL